MLLQTSFISYIMQLPNLLTLAIELIGIYLYFRESLLKQANKIQTLEKEVSDLKNLSIKVISLESKIELINNNMGFLVRDFEKMDKAIEKICDDNQKTKDYIHRMTGSIEAIAKNMKND